ncbi:tetraspanin-8-like [Labrus mixtus]|uniref:tetraspanin-8-like n=1 Tax=Labrus mixtus TaxID=508554 RepID=UPI0029BFDBAD|nr:tetraspanin-8-like [Labrus mixtus]
MGRVNVWLKRSYVITSSLIAIISTLLLGLTVFSHGALHKDEEIEEMLTGLHGMYAVSLIPLLLSIIGLYGVCKQKKWALIVFAVGFIVGILFLTFCGIQALVELPEMAEHVETKFQSYVPLSDANDRISNAINEFQTQYQCCGLGQGYRDWGQQFPNSCLCTEESTSPCELAPWSGSLTLRGTVKPIRIYKESCLPHLIAYHAVAMNYLLGMALGIALLWLLPVVLCILILCRLNQKEKTQTVVYSPEAMSGNYITLLDAADTT